jgi:hypothetical protein
MPSPRLDVEALYVALDAQRRRARLRWRDIAVEAGVSPSTLTRIGQGFRPDADGLVRLLVWLGQTDVRAFLAAQQVRVQAQGDGETT